MIFKMFGIYHKAKQGVNDPAGLVADEAAGVVSGVAILPGIILAGVVVILGILSFTSWIVAPSLLAKIFFFIFALVLAGYIFAAVVIVRFIKKAITRAGEKVEKTYYEINN